MIPPPASYSYKYNIMWFDENIAYNTRYAHGRLVQVVEIKLNLWDPWRFAPVILKQTLPVYIYTVPD